MEDPHNSWSTRKLIEVLKVVHGCYDQLRVGEKLEQFLSTSGVKQGDNLAPVLLSLSSTQYPTLDKKWDFTTPDFRWFPDTQVGSKPRGQLRGTNHSNKGTMFSFFKSYYVVIRPSFFSAAEVIAASSLSSLTFDVSDYSHWK
jgi:hypothetical protein